MVGGVNKLIVRSDGEIIDALGPTEGDLTASVGITGRGRPNITGEISLDRGDGASVCGESEGQIIPDVVGDSANHATGIGEGPDLRRNGRLVLRGKNQTAPVW